MPDTVVRKGMENWLQPLVRPSITASSVDSKSGGLNVIINDYEHRIFESVL